MDQSISCILVDDEPLALERLERLLQPYPQIRILDKISRPSEAVERIETLCPDLLFLDIQMPGMNGFELLNRLDHQSWIIFVTAYDQYALEAFDANSIDYLLKPVRQERLERALNKLFHLIRPATNIPGLSPDWKKLLDYVKRQQQTLPQKLVSRKGDRIIVLDPGEIVFLYAESKYTFAVTLKEEHILDYTLQQLRDWLPAEKFIPIHRSYLVNLDWIAELHRGFGGGMLCRLKNPLNKDLPVSRSLIKPLREKLHF
jgi:two-component system, LytTR family, response regulator